MTKVLLINCVDPKQSINFKFDGLGLAYIASYVKEYGGFGNVKIVDVGGVKDFGLIEKFKPDVIGLSSLTQNFNIIKEVSREIQVRLDVPVIVGGYHISALPNNLNCDMDIGVVGEGEQTFLELLSEYEKHGLDLKKLKHVDGLIYWDSGNLNFNSKRKLISPLDKIPFPFRHLLKNRSGKFYMFTSRGCSYSCSFCSSSAFWGCVRFFSPEYVVREIKHLVYGYEVKNITFYDDLFIADKKRVSKIADLLNAEKLDVSFECSVRSNLVNDEVASVLKRMNVTRVSMGLESGCDRILKRLKGSTVSVEKNLDAVKLLKKYRFGIGGSFVIGSPNESERDVMKTLDFIRVSGVNVGETYVLLPFPSTKMWFDCKRKGLVNDFMDWERFCMYLSDNSDRVIVSDKISRERLLFFVSVFKFEWGRRYWKYGFFYGVFHLKETLYFVRDKVKNFIVGVVNR